MKFGLYEQIVDLILEKKLESTNGKKLFKSLKAVDSHTFLSQYLYRILAQGLAQVKADKGIKREKERSQNKLSNQINICNEIINVLINGGLEGFNERKISYEATRLLAILEEAGIKSEPPRPDTPLALGALLTGTRQDPSLSSQLKKEILTSDRIDILCSFIKWSGIRILKENLEEFLKRNDTKIRIITTSYMGATDLKAIEFLNELPNTEIKVSYDTHRTRLHAKAYLFYRETGFSSAYIGSANISQAALTDGLEWNIKISQYEQPFQWEKTAATFETYWNDSEFELYQTGDKIRLKKSLSEERNTLSNNGDFVLPNFDLRPYGFQSEILECIQAERELHDINKHLIVAATGTGKTMIAAFDFKNWQKIKQRRNSTFLFIAHREEILKQSLYTFRAVLRDQNFGDLMVGGRMPDQIDQLFLSIQTYNSQKIDQAIINKEFDYIVVDEFHHSAAKSYKKLLNNFKPESLIGLTATPERADGLDIKKYFDNHITSEIRLPDAINRKLLSPFQYFGITDSEDYSNLKWQKGGYVHKELNNLLTGNDKRANLIIEKTVETVLDIKGVKGIGFCVSKDHARFMSDRFNKANIPSEYLTADSNKEIRNSVQEKLKNLEINFIFVVDLYNEGVDIPEIDTVLFLRPTESLTIFLQQLGRGLRLSDGKDCLTVFDFVGQAHNNYRFDLRLKALITDKTRRIEDELEDEFPHLPSGCTIQFERQAKKYILENIKKSLLKSKPRIVNNIATFTEDTGLPLNLQNFIEYYKLGLDEIFRRATWSRLCYEANEREEFNDKDEIILTKGLRRLQHINDYYYIKWLLEKLKEKNIIEANLTEIEERRFLMLHFILWGKDYDSTSLLESFKQIFENQVLKSDLIELLNYCKMKISFTSPDLNLPFTCPLKLHAHYTRNEILAAFNYWNLEKQPAMREGCLYIKEVQTDIFFITLNKSEKDYSPTTMYEDYAINENLFHWQSQSTTSPESPTGQRFINHKKNNNTILLFVRENIKNTNNLAEPYYFLGPVEYVEHSGSRPISFIWKLENKLPACLLRETVQLAVG